MQTPLQKNVTRDPTADATSQHCKPWANKNKQQIRTQLRRTKRPKCGRRTRTLESQIKQHTTKKEASNNHSPRNDVVPIMIATTLTSKQEQQQHANKKSVPCKKQAWTSEPAMPLEHINFKSGRKCLVTSLLSNHSTLPSLLGKHLSLSEMLCKHLRKIFNVVGL
jgi:hypothetical protein